MNIETKGRVRFCASRKCAIPFLFFLFSYLEGGAQTVVPALVDGKADSDAHAPGEAWIDRVQRGLHRLVWRTGMSVDRLAGSKFGEEAYEGASGSLAIALLWDEYEGWDPKVRFGVDLPLPQLNERYRLFLGRLNPDEYVTERREDSGAIPHHERRFEEDETLAGIVYSQPPRTGGRFSASVGARVRTLDPYVKASYRYARMIWGETHFRIKETLFWRRSEGFGLTSRVDLQTDFGPRWFAQWTSSGTFSEESDGLRGYAGLTITHIPYARRSISARFFLEGETDAPVAVHHYGVQVAFRKIVWREWLVLEVRTDLTWPKEIPTEPRKPSWGFGLGFQMYFGDEAVSLRPVTF